MLISLLAFRRQNLIILTPFEMKTFQILLIILSVATAATLGSVVSRGGGGLEEGRRLIKTSEDEPGTWLLEDEILGLIRNGQTFIDVTDSKYPAADSTKIIANAIPRELRFQETVKRLINNLNSPRVVDFVREFSSYHNRYYNSQTGRASQLWLVSEVEDSLRNYPGTATVAEVDHGYPQKSVVARLEGADPRLKAEVVVFGAHLDSLNMYGSSLRAPGADDNASGSVVGLETLRIIVEAGLVFNRTVEMHWYAAEEIGLRGSQAIAEEYKRTNVNVVAMLNMDVVGYYVSGLDDIAIYTDYGSAELAQLLRILTEEYLSFGWQNNVCGYGCSDHASWNRAGFPAIFAGEAVDHPDMHTESDNIQAMNFNQVNEFIKLAIGYVIEMAEPNRSSSS